MAVFFFSYLIHFSKVTNLQKMVSSDGDGYYAYLPALFIQKDASYQKTKKMQESYNVGVQNYYYLNKTNKGRVVNKYYPGTAIFHLPAFTFTSIILSVFHKPITGYSSLYMLGVFFTGLFFSLFGIYFLFKALKIYFKNYLKEKSHSIWIGVFCIFFGTNLFVSVLSNPSLSHTYSFFLFCLLIYNFQTYLSDKKIIKLIFLGFLMGLIFLVRPTNILFVLFLVFFFSSLKELKLFLIDFFSFKKTSFIYLLVPFLLLASIILFLNKWQTNEYFYWSYQGEGFNFFKPHFWETWFSYRIGIFVHNPILFISLIGLYYIYKDNKYRFYCWLFYFIFITYIISSWWCWDYETSFGHRGFSEHFILFFFPFIYLLKNLGRKKVIVSIIIFSILYIMMRFYQKNEGIFPRQKFTKETYWKSFLDLNSNETEKYLNLEHCFPFGEIKKTTCLKTNYTLYNFNDRKEFAFETKFNFPQKRIQNRFVVEISFKKKPLEKMNWKDIFLVTDSYSTIDNSREYTATPIYTYFEEGQGNFSSSIIHKELFVCYNQKDFVNIYIWNQNKKKFKIKDLKIKIYEYSNEK